MQIDAPHLKVIYDENSDGDQPLPGCQRYPVWWVPHTGVQHNGTTVGVKYRCDQCGFEGKGVFGPARAFASTAQAAEKAMINSDEAKKACHYWVTPVARA